MIQEKCTGCAICTEYCPIKIPDVFNLELSRNKAIHVHFAQAIPLIAYIDKECIYLKEKKCRICENVCENKAIDFNQKEEKEDIKVGAIIVSAGFSPFDATLLKEYGYRRFKNVITSMDFERILSSTGPYEGEIKRPSDLSHPHKIAWIQCIGSRQVIKGGNSYCSSVCCTYTQKQVILAKDHINDAKCTVFHNDIRAYGKDFERYYQRAISLSDVRFIRSYVSVVREDKTTGKVFIRYATTNKGVIEEEFDMVILSVGISPPKDAEALAQKMGINLNRHKFVDTDPINISETGKKGVYVSSAFISPMDIPEAVVTASAAATKAKEQLKTRRYKLSMQRVYPLEKNISEDQPRVGVFVCACGANIGRVVNIYEVAEFAKTLPNVNYVQTQLFSCSTSAAKEITEAIKTHNLNRIVVAACTPRTHEPTFRDSLREAGINQYLLDMANIREHCSWVHSKEKDEATKKAKELVKKSVARVLKLEPLSEISLSVDKRALVVGGGVAGMNAALNIANQGFEVYLVEKENRLGGMAKNLFYSLSGIDVQEYLATLIKKVYENPLIHLLESAKIIEATGYVGNFSTKIESKGRTFEIKHGVTIIATGAEEYKPTEYLYEKSELVITNLELENRIYNKDSGVINAESICFIQCVGCRNEDRNYCSRICCSQSIKNALKLKELNKNIDIYILFRDIRTYGFNEDFYRQASEREVRFIRFEPENPPLVEEFLSSGKKQLKITVYDDILGKNLEIQADLLSLAAAVIPNHDNSTISQLFKLSISVDGFFKEAHVKLRPVDFGTDGVFVAGTAHYPKTISETVSQSLAAASRASSLLSADSITASGSICDVDEKKCIGCGACFDVCSYGAVELKKTSKGQKAYVNPVLCKGDGLCNAFCPTSAIQLRHFRDEQINSELEDLLRGKIIKKIKKAV